MLLLVLILIGADVTNNSIGEPRIVQSHWKLMAVVSQLALLMMGRAVSFDFKIVLLPWPMIKLRAQVHT